MKNKLMFWIAVILACPVPALAAGEDWIAKNNQLFFYGMVGFGGLSLLLIIWEVIYQIASARSASAPAKMNIVSEFSQGPDEDHDPIKALLQEQVKGSGPARDESSLPSFLQDKSGGGQGKAENLGAPEPGSDDDPFKRLLQKSGSEDSADDKPASPPRKMIIHPPKTSATSPQASPDAEDDPFKKLLAKSADDTGVSAPQVSRDEPPEPLGIEALPPSKDVPKKLAFNMPKSSKPSGASKLFDRISEGSSSASPGGDNRPQKAVAPPKKLSLGGARKAPPLSSPTPGSPRKPSGGSPSAGEAQSTQKPAVKRLELKFKPKSKE